MVLATACFCHLTEAEIGMGFLKWMAVAQTNPNMLLGIDSWQRLGIGCFIIAIIIKHLPDNGIAPSPRQNRNKQGSWGCGDNPSFHNSTGYRSCGFKQINLQNENNCELLPRSLQEHMDGDGTLLWWVSILGDDEQIPPLLYLPPGQMLKKPLTICSWTMTR